MRSVASYFSRPFSNRWGGGRFPFSRSLAEQQECWPGGPQEGGLRLDRGRGLSNFPKGLRRYDSPRELLQVLRGGDPLDLAVRRVLGDGTELRSNGLLTAGRSSTR
jgi:hypothetical protein